jgi:AcrR family transcriptional regulator
MPPAQRREQLIDAALQVILDQGYSGVSIEAVAREAGVTRPVVYDHFPNLGRLLHALIEREERISLEQLERVVPDDPADKDPVELRRSGRRADSPRDPRAGRGCRQHPAHGPRQLPPGAL